VVHLDDWEMKQLVEADLSIGLRGKQQGLLTNGMKFTTQK
jgi:hypothetical protein